MTPEFQALAETAVANLKLRAGQAADLRRLPDETVAELHDLGLWKLMTPRKYGGSQQSPETLSAVLEILARGCPSTAWVYNIYLAVPFVVSTMSDAAQAEFFAEPGARSSLTFSPSGTLAPIEGGYRLRGQWRFATGQHHAQWSVLCAMIVDREGNPQGPAQMLVPRGDLDTLDDWDVSGLRGTGSNTLATEGLFVPAHRVRPLEDVATGNAGSALLSGDPDYQYPLVPFFAAISGANGVGMAGAALDLVRARIKKRGITYSGYDRQSEAPITHFQLAEAAMKLDQARFHSDRSLASLGPIRSDPSDVLLRVRCRADLAWCMNLCRQVADVLQSASGASSIALADPLQRLVSDIRALSLHSFILFNTCTELYGRVLCGQEPDVPYY